MTSQLIPVTIIGGYLGAGKTTLLNRLLAGHHGRRLAVLVNDFGSVNIDADLIAAHDGDTISLQNGCVCCSIADALGDALDQVLALEPLPDQIVIEASGVADPAKIAHYGQGWPGCRLDAVVVLADAETIKQRAQDQFVGELVTRQLSGGDLILLTKTDLVGEDTLDGLRSWIDGATGGGPTVLPVVRGAIDPALVLDTQAASMAVWEPSQVEPSTDELFDSAVLEIPGPVTRARMEAALDHWPAGIVRAKGFVTLEEDRARHVVQRVGRRWSIEPAAGVEAGAAGRIVVIGLKDSVDLAKLDLEV
ncbi:MAG: GTP-binding protein [Actinomycetia bacterium]|nr:GTP-binding protein [Actinomycetes bacterium]